MNNETTESTRRESYEAIKPETSKRGTLILEVLGDKEMTVDEIVYALMNRGKIHAFDRNFVAPRLTVLKAAGLVEVVGKRASGRTGKKVAVWARAKSKN